MDPDLIEGMVLLESAGRPDARASDDLESAAGLTQILAADRRPGCSGCRWTWRPASGSPRSSAAPAARARRRASGRGAARVDERFDPAKALAATGRYLKQAKDEFGREDLAVVSYHMGIGNLQSVLGAYGDDDASYAQLYFDTLARQPRARVPAAAGLGDDSKTYYWRVLASREVMRLYRDDRAQARAAGGAPGGRGLGRAGAAPGRHRRRHRGGQPAA